MRLLDLPLSCLRRPDCSLAAAMKHSHSSQTQPLSILAKVFSDCDSRTLLQLHACLCSASSRSARMR
jgi:hypothetical protein